MWRKGSGGFFRDGVPHERIAILLPMRRSLAPLMREVLADFEIEADMDTGMSLAESTVVQTVLDVLEVPLSDFHRERVVRMLSSPYLRFRPPGEEEAVSSYVIDRLSREASIVEGKENWSARFRSLVHRLQEEAASPDVPDWRRHQFERKVQEVERASKNLEPLLERLSSLDTVRKVGDHVRAIRETLGHLEMDRHLHGTDPTNSRREGAAFRQFLGVLDRMETSRLLCDQEFSFSQMVSMMRERAIGLDRQNGGRAGKVHYRGRSAQRRSQGVRPHIHTRSCGGGHPQARPAPSLLQFGGGAALRPAVQPGHTAPGALLFPHGPALLQERGTSQLVKERGR